MPNDLHLQLGNSSVVRYVQLFDNYPGVPQYGNRGTSGIDGCTSTAAGYAYISDQKTLLITGDISFFYDTNGLWHHNLSPKLRIILINNGGGGIFKIIDGPSKAPELENYFITQQSTSAQSICEAYGLDYSKAENITEVDELLKGDFYEASGRPKLLEVISDPDSNVVLKEYFRNL